MRVLSVIGARPQVVKAAVVSRALAARDVDEVVVATGQHFDDEMFGVFIEELGMPRPRHELGINGGSHGSMTGRMLEALDPIVLDEQPTVVVVYGDTNSTLAGALSAAKLHVPVAHVEAGLRSFDRAMPEEINRVVTDHLSTLLFCPTATAVRNLEAEGLLDGVRNVGDVMYDATVAARHVAARSTEVLDRLGLTDGGYSVATVHRAANTDDPERLRTIVSYLEDQAAERPVVLPLHPRTRAAADRAGIDLDRLLITPPIGYLDMHRLLSGAVGVFTDSGGLQKEAYFHRVPCVTLRDTTEWVETVDAGWNRLWTTDHYQRRRDIDEYGDGHSAERIADQLLEWMRTR